MRRLYPAIFLVSCSTLMYEVALTRIFSIALWYHFAFMIISIAMLGIGSAGTVLSLFTPGPAKRDNRIQTASDISDVSPCSNTESKISLYAAATGFSILLCYIIANQVPFDPVRFAWEKIQFLYLAVYCLVLSIPFFFFGILISTAFIVFSRQAMSIYGCDLIGAGAGSLAVLAILNTTGPEYAVLTASTLCLTGSLLSGKKQILIPALVLIAGNLIIFLIHPAFIDVSMSPYKSMPRYLQYPGAEHLKTYHSSYAQIDTFRSPAVRLAPGLSLRYIDPLPEQRAIASDGDKVHAITGAGDIERLGFLAYMPSSLAYEIAKKDRGLIIDSSGGLHVLMARYYKFREVVNVESNPAVVKIVREDFTAFSGDIFGDGTRTGQGRNFLSRSLREKERPRPLSIATNDQQAHSRRLYDLIDLPVSGTSVSGSFGISENYRYTVEAFTTYLRALKKDGMIAVSVYLAPPPRTEFRILATMIKALKETGIGEAPERVAAIRSWDTMTILVRKSPFTDREIRRIKDFSASRRFDVVYYPGIQEGESNTYVRVDRDIYFEGFRQLLDNQARASFMDDYLFDISPVHDDNPFFHYYLKAGNIAGIYDTMGRKWLYFLGEGYLLPVLFCTVLILSAVLIVLPAALNSGRSRLNKHEISLLPSTLAYFSMLGIGFMFVEVTLIQKGIFLLENPAYSVSVVLTAILVSSGIGSMCSAKYSRLAGPGSLIILVCLVAIYAALFPPLSAWLSAHELTVRIVLVFLMLFPLGFFMGIPFPMGLKLLGQHSTALIPWAWAINASLSVLAPILTIMTALVTGFMMVLYIGACIYFLAFIAFMQLKKKELPLSP